MSFNIEYFGTSHGPSVGVRASGLPVGEAIDVNELAAFLSRRSPGTSSKVSARTEPDDPIIKSGITNGLTDGDTLEIEIKNVDARDNDYSDLKDIPRPGHADYTAYVKYGSDYDMTGGGQFSGRLTAPLCALGGICLQMLKRRNISISASVIKTGDVDGAIENGDSVGGIIECQIDGVPAGVGGPFANGLESRLSFALFAIPAVKGVEFGAGFKSAELKGSECNDEYCIENDVIKTKSNNCGGILGGISNGMPIVFRVAFKPTPSIALPQQSINLKTMEEVTVNIKGRHDPCIALRSAPIVEAAAAICLTEILSEEDKL
ncbi:MAG: chorismate synthase [Clostridia bacterium]|nr:chorismate synthase [Clostridia bacterium]